MRLKGLGTVSYTHLDVYKRQVLRLTPEQFASDVADYRRRIEALTV